MKIKLSDYPKLLGKNIKSSLSSYSKLKSNYSESIPIPYTIKLEFLNENKESIKISNLINGINNLKIYLNELLIWEINSPNQSEYEIELPEIENLIEKIYCEIDSEKSIKSNYLVRGNWNLIFGENSWADLSKISEFINKNNFDTNDFKDYFGWDIEWNDIYKEEIIIDNLNRENKYKFLLIDINHDIDENGNKIGFTFMGIGYHSIPRYNLMNEYEYNGQIIPESKQIYFPLSYLNYKTQEIFYKTFKDFDLINYLKYTIKESYNGIEKKKYKTKIFLPSISESGYYDGFGTVLVDSKVKEGFSYIRNFYNIFSFNRSYILTRTKYWYGTDYYKNHYYAFGTPLSRYDGINICDYFYSLFCI